MRHGQCLKEGGQIYSHLANLFAWSIIIIRLQNIKAFCLIWCKHLDKQREVNLSCRNHNLFAMLRFNLNERESTQ
jgi:hypothetical protein